VVLLLFVVSFVFLIHDNMKKSFENRLEFLQSQWEKQKNEIIEKLSQKETTIQQLNRRSSHQESEAKTKIEMLEQNLASKRADIHLIKNQLSTQSEQQRSEIGAVENQVSELRKRSNALEASLISCQLLIQDNQTEEDLLVRKSDAHSEIIFLEEALKNSKATIIQLRAELKEARAQAHQNDQKRIAAELQLSKLRSTSSTVDRVQSASLTATTPEIVTGHDQTCEEILLLKQIQADDVAKRVFHLQKEINLKCQETRQENQQQHTQHEFEHKQQPPNIWKYPRRGSRDRTTFEEDDEDADGKFSLELENNNRQEIEDYNNEEEIAEDDVDR